MTSPSDSLQTSERPTPAEFEELLDACLGAHAHARWVSENGTDDEYAVALRATSEAYRAVVNAACAPCPGCGMELK